MRVYTYSEARQNLSTLLDEAEKLGPICIRRRDGRTFIVQAEKSASSPLAVEGVDLGLSREEIVGLVREARERGR